MTNEKAKKMLKAKLECLKRETSGTDIDCNYRNCDECNLCYEQGNMGEQKEALEMAIKALEQTEWIPISDRLPEEYMFCLISVKIEPLDCEISYEVDKARFYRNQFISQSIESVGVIAKKSVIAWMPLPQPYKAESE